MDEVNVTTTMSRKVMSVLLLLVAGHLGMVHAGVGLGATRVIYPDNQPQVTLGVSNNDSNGTFLIQSWVENADGQKDGRLVITPPLYLMQGKKENTLRIIDATNKSLPKDRESLFWVNVKAIPSLDKSREEENTLQLAITSRIKLFYRPLGLSVAPDKAPEQLRFKRNGTALSIVNPTPYFITLSELKAGTRALENAMVSPMGAVSVTLPADAGSNITYRTINDYGAQTAVLKGVLQ
ncbi:MULTISPECIES: fimbria/pilus periplasmic chaperone [unclassified Serratia (in: enterobacteria)]|uniref:fimbria/pilus periplasmic chaperone n=1 Tax=unclassified Serratia (in: enterobacteria) TaxID=2647522 RepID=UPI000502AC69|nr:MULTISPECIES: fimbria/pilus periplasmic chaperone [unclassified Serratia (in: enterobacteria)]KFK91728.1 molecular chaperone FimC [Serratia sp. Ag2]KFK95654.1 molecular chaperone FimC [Serratia sp. Ag1]